MKNEEDEKVGHRMIKIFAVHGRHGIYKTLEMVLQINKKLS